VDSARKMARLFGVLYIITFITSIPALLLYGPVLDHTNYIVGAGADTRVEWGAFLELLLIISNIGTAVVLFPILSGKMSGLLSAMSPHDSWNARSSPSASSAFSPS